MAIKSETKTLRLTFVDGINKNVSYSIASPKADLDKATVDAAANAIVDAKNLCDRRRRQPDGFERQPDRNT